MKTFSMITAAAILAATSLSAQQVEILPGYSDFRAPEAMVLERPMDLVSDWVAGFPESPEGRPHLTLNAELADSGLLVIEITEFNLLDDSVASVQRRYELSPAEAGWHLVAFGHRQQCYRGSDGEWQADPCL